MILVKKAVLNMQINHKVMGWLVFQSGLAAIRLYHTVSVSTISSRRSSALILTGTKLMISPTHANYCESKSIKGLLSILASPRGFVLCVLIYFPNQN